MQNFKNRFEHHIIHIYSQHIQFILSKVRLNLQVPVKTEHIWLRCIHVNCIHNIGAKCVCVPRHATPPTENENNIQFFRSRSCFVHGLVYDAYVLQSMRANIHTNTTISNMLCSLSHPLIRKRKSRNVYEIRSVSYGTFN